MPLFEHQFSAIGQGHDGKRVRLSPQSTLARFGPVLQVAISITPEHAERLSELGEQPPAPISGLALIDTGASITAVDEEVCLKLGLPATGTVIMSHAAGNEERACYPIQVMFPGSPLPPLASPKVVSCKLHSPQILLLGRDLLAMLRLVYHGPAGRIELAF